MLVFVPPEKACPVVQAFPLFVGRCPTPCQGRVFEKTPLGSLKNFFRFLKAKPDNLVGVSCRDFVPPEKACPVAQAFPLFVGRCPTPCQGAFLKKRPLEPAKKFSDRPLFQKGSPGCRAGPCKKNRVQGRDPEKRIRRGPKRKRRKALYRIL